MPHDTATSNTKPDITRLNLIDSDNPGLYPLVPSSRRIITVRVVVDWPAPCAGVLLLIELALVPSAGDRGVLGLPSPAAFIRPDELLLGTVPCEGDGLLFPASCGGEVLPETPPVVVVPCAAEALSTAGAFGLVVFPVA